MRPTEIVSRARSRRARWRLISSYQIRTLNPKVTGSAWMPWVRPMQMVFLCLSASRFRIFLSSSRRLRMRSSDCRMIIDRAVSTTS